MSQEVNQEVHTPVIDAVVGLNTSEIAKSRPAWAESFFGTKIGASEETVAGVSLENYVALMDAAGIDRSILFSPLAGPEGDPRAYRPSPRHVQEAVRKYPDRFSAVIGVDPTAGMRGVRELEAAVTDDLFIGAHGYPHWFDLPPDDRRWYPIYSKCCELDIPIQLQVGHCLAYDSERPLRSVGRPITLDTVACDFPELKLVGIHIGWPWTEEMIAIAYKHQNVYIGSDAYAPRHWDKSFVRFIDSWGAGKVLFGTDFPVIDPKRARDEIATLGIRAQSLSKFMGGNAQKVYQIS